MLDPASLGSQPQLRLDVRFRPSRHSEDLGDEYQQHHDRWLAIKKSLVIGYPLRRTAAQAHSQREEAGRSRAFRWLSVSAISVFQFETVPLLSRLLAHCRLVNFE